MELNREELLLLEKWMSDESFGSWALNTREQDIEKWEKYFALNIEQKELGETARKLLIGIPVREIPIDIERRSKALLRLMDAVDGKSKAKTVLKNERKRYGLGRGIFTMAAIVLLLLFAGRQYYNYGYNPELKLVTGYGMTIDTVLPDGSAVILNANSELRYRRQTPRKVTVRGEAFFDVAKKPETGADFQVVTSDVTITVLGTSFNVNSRKDRTKVFLEEGKVALKLKNTEQEEIEMSPGDLVSYSSADGKVLEKKKDNSVENISWKEGVLFMNDTPLREALSQVSEIYGIEFELASEDLEERALNGGVPIRDLQITLQTFQDVFGISVLQVGEKYMIK